MSSLRYRLIAAFLAATLVPLAVTLWITTSLLEQGLRYAPTQQLDAISLSLEKTAREYYQQARESLRAEASSGKASPERYHAARRDPWPGWVRDFEESGQPERFELAGDRGQTLEYLVRHGREIWVYSRSLGVPLGRVRAEYADARDTVRSAAGRDLLRGLTLTFVLLAAAVWLVALALLVWSAYRISRPIRELTAALQTFAAGNLSVRVPVRGGDEVGAAVAAFNDMAAQLEQSRERLLFLTRLASWQALARKMAHEVKNSLTPIRLTMEEVAARGGGDAFLEQAAQIVVDEVTTLERRVRAFSDFAAEPPVHLGPLDVNSLVEERVAFLKNAHPEVVYDVRLARPIERASADADLIKGVLTNLLENAAEAAGPGGVVMARTAPLEGKLAVEVHDSGPGLSLHARSSLFEPTISFKKAGMGLGLSIARKSALLSGGDIVAIDSDLGGAGFRVLLRSAGQPGQRDSDTNIHEPAEAHSHRR